jgi:hypothetical protein
MGAMGFPSAGTTGRSANPMPFSRLSRGDIILWCPDLRTLSETTPQWRDEIHSLRANFEA